jgi:hypothetical protein
MSFDAPAQRIHASAADFAIRHAELMVPLTASSTVAFGSAAI